MDKIEDGVQETRPGAYRLRTTYNYERHQIDLQVINYRDVPVCYIPTDTEASIADLGKSLVALGESLLAREGRARREEETKVGSDHEERLKNHEGELKSRLSNAIIEYNNIINELLRDHEVLVTLDRCRIANFALYPKTEIVEFNLPVKS